MSRVNNSDYCAGMGSTGDVVRCPAKRDLSINPKPAEKGYKITQLEPLRFEVVFYHPTFGWLPQSEWEEGREER